MFNSNKFLSFVNTHIFVNINKYTIKFYHFFYLKSNLSFLVYKKTLQTLKISKIRMFLANLMIKYMKKSKLNIIGFTIIELLVVITILAILGTV
jgi:prepilin-type N-terminal cleavage/methylation domain-containing protein